MPARSSVCITATAASTPTTAATTITWRVMRLSFVLEVVCFLGCGWDCSRVVATEAPPFQVVGAYASVTPFGEAPELVEVGHSVSLAGTLDLVTLYLEVGASTVDAYALEAFNYASLVPNGVINTVTGDGDANGEGDDGTGVVAPLSYTRWAASVLAGLPNCVPAPGAMWRFEPSGPRSAPTLVATCAVLPPGAPGVRVWLPENVLPERAPLAAAAAAVGRSIGDPEVLLGAKASLVRGNLESPWRLGVNPASTPLIFGTAPTMPYPGTWPSNGTMLSVVGVTLVVCVWTPVGVAEAGTSVWPQSAPRDWDCTFTSQAGVVASASTDGVQAFGTVSAATLVHLPDGVFSPAGTVLVRVMGIPTGAAHPAGDPWWSWSWRAPGTTTPVPCGPAGGTKVPGGGMPPAWVSAPVNLTRGQPWQTLAPGPMAGSGLLIATRADGGRVLAWPTPRVVGPTDGPMTVTFGAPVRAVPTGDTAAGNFTLWLLPIGINGVVLGPDTDGALGPFHLSVANALAASGSRTPWAIDVVVPTWIANILPELGGFVSWNLVLQPPPGTGFAPGRFYVRAQDLEPASGSIAEDKVQRPDIPLPTQSQPAPGDALLAVGTIKVTHCPARTESIFVGNADVGTTVLNTIPVLRLRGAAGTTTGGTDIFPDGTAAWWIPALQLTVSVTCETAPVFRTGTLQRIEPSTGEVLNKAMTWLSRVTLRVNIPRLTALTFDLGTTGGSDAQWIAATPACDTAWGVQPRLVLNTTAVSVYTGGAVLDTLCVITQGANNLAAVRIPEGVFALRPPVPGKTWGIDAAAGPGPDSPWLWFGSGFPTRPFGMPANNSVVEWGQLLKACPMVDLAARDNGTTDVYGPTPFLTPVCDFGAGLLGADTTPDVVRGRMVTHAGTAYPMTDFLPAAGDRALNATRGAVVLAYVDNAAIGTPGPWWKWDPLPAVTPGTDVVALPPINSVAYPVACMFRLAMGSRAYGWASPAACTSVNLSAEHATVSATRWDGVKVVYWIPIRTRGHAIMPPPPPPAAALFMFGVSIQPVWTLSICPVRLVFGDTLDVDCSPYSIVATVDVTPRWFLPRYATTVPPGDYWGDVASVRFAAPNNSYNALMSTGELLFAVVSLFPIQGPEFYCTQSKPLLNHVFQGMWVGRVVHNYDTGYPWVQGNTNESANSTALGYVRVPSNLSAVASVQLFSQEFACYLRSDGSMQRQGSMTGPSLLLMTDPGPAPTATASATPTRSPSPSNTPTASGSITPTVSITPSRTPTISITPSRTPTISVTPSRTPSVTPTISITPSRTSSTSRSASQTPSSSRSPSATATISVTSSRTPTSSRSPSATATISRSSTVSPSLTRTPSPSRNWLAWPVYAVYLVPVTVTNPVQVGVGQVNFQDPSRIWLGNFSAYVDSLNPFTATIPRPIIPNGAATGVNMPYGVSPYVLATDVPRHVLTGAPFTVLDRAFVVDQWKTQSINAGMNVTTSLLGATDMVPQVTLFIPTAPMFWNSYSWQGEFSIHHKNGLNQDIYGYKPVRLTVCEPGYTC